MTDSLAVAISLASDAHAGQTDKAGAPYILHPLRVMLSMATADERIVAVLHDVVEDTPLTLPALSRHFEPHIVAALDCLTRRDGETYDDFVERIAGNPLAARVKMADLRDNMDLSRLPNITDKDVSRYQKYKSALGVLKVRLNGAPA